MDKHVLCWYYGTYHANVVRESLCLHRIEQGLLETWMFLERKDSSSSVSERDGTTLGLLERLSSMMGSFNQVNGIELVGVQFDSWFVFRRNREAVTPKWHASSYPSSSRSKRSYPSRMLGDNMFVWTVQFASRISCSLDSFRFPSSVCDWSNFTRLCRDRDAQKAKWTGRQWSIPARR